MRRLAVSLLLATGLAGVAPVLADSRASRGMRAGPGPCMAVATATERALLWPESRGWPTAANPRSSARGCGQLLRAMRRAHYPKGCHVDTLNVGCQMAGFRRYVKSRYGSAERALAARRRKGWY